MSKLLARQADTRTSVFMSYRHIARPQAKKPKSDESGTGRDESGSVIRFAHGWPCAFVLRVDEPAMKHRGEQAHDGDLFPSRWN
jgi:hypothetical protein